MNWLDILLIIINAILFIIGIVTIIVAIIKRNDSWSDAILIAITYWICYVLVGTLLIFIPFMVVDKASGSTTGTITSVDKNFFGTTALYIKTTETKEEKYCIEFDEELESQAKELIGKKVKISYGKRVGLYSTGKCHQAPIETIEEIENEKNN